VISNTRYLGLSVEDFNLGWVARYGSPTRGVLFAGYRYARRSRRRIESRAPALRCRSARAGLSPVEALYILQEKWEPSP
jgi:hypothetical protein